MGKNNSRNIRQYRYLKLSLVILVSVALIVVIQTALGIGLWNRFDSNSDTEKLNDIFTVINTLFSGLAFFGLLIAIFLQSRQLKAQLKELELAREEYAKATRAAEKSSKILKNQFQLNIKDQKARLHFDIIKELFSASDEVRKFYYKVDYNNFKFRTDAKFLKKFEGSEDERLLDSLLYKYNAVAFLIRSGILEFNDINYMIFPLKRIYENRDVQRYLKWLELENWKWGDADMPRFKDFIWLMGEAKEKMRKKSDDQP